MPEETGIASELEDETATEETGIAAELEGGAAALEEAGTMAELRAPASDEEDSAAEDELSRVFDSSSNSANKSRTWAKAPEDSKRRDNVTTIDRMGEIYKIRRRIPNERIPPSSGIPLSFSIWSELSQP